MIDQFNNIIDMYIFRTNEEFNTSHIENAFNVPYMFKTQEGIDLNCQTDPPVLCNLIWLKLIYIFFVIINHAGKVKNPEFLTQISSILEKQDHLVVVINQLLKLSNGSFPSFFLMESIILLDIYMYIEGLQQRRQIT